MKNLLIIAVLVLGSALTSEAQSLKVNNYTGCQLAMRTWADIPNTPAPGAICPYTGGTSREVAVPPGTTVYPANSFMWLSCAGVGWEPNWIWGNVAVHDFCPSGLSMVSGTDGGQSTGNWCLCFSGGYTSTCSSGCGVTNMVWTDAGGGTVVIDIY